MSSILYPDRARSARHPAAELALSRAAAGARKAPVVGTDRPWRWELSGDHAELHLPPAAAHAAVSLVNSGSALHHARTVLAGEGARAHIRLLPDPAAPHRLAALDVTGFQPATPDEIRAHRAVALRSTTVAPAGRAAVPASAFRTLAAAAAANGATVEPMSRGARPPAVGALVVADVEDAATLLRLGQAQSAVALAGALERLTITVAPALTTAAAGRPAVRIGVEPLTHRSAAEVSG